MVNKDEKTKTYCVYDDIIEPCKKLIDNTAHSGFVNIWLECTLLSLTKVVLEQF